MRNASLVTGLINADHFILYPFTIRVDYLLPINATMWGVCGAVVRGSLRTHKIDGSIPPEANQAFHPSGVGKLVPEDLGG